jgi:methylmalonyl-CoA/ethylmalonyl-CoA epimerase
MGVRLKRVDHVGIIVDDLDEAASLFRDSLGLTLTRETNRPELRAAFYSCQGVAIELIEILDPAMRAERLRGDAVIEHVAFEVENLNATTMALEAVGIKPKAPARQSGDSLTFWTDPRTSDGIVLQFLVRIPPGSACAQ